MSRTFNNRKGSRHGRRIRGANECWTGYTIPPDNKTIRVINRLTDLKDQIASWEK